MLRRNGIKICAVMVIAVAAGALAMGEVIRSAGQIDGPAETATQAVLDNLRARELAIIRVNADFVYETEENTDEAVVAYRNPQMGPLVPRRVLEGRLLYDNKRFYEDQVTRYPVESGSYWFVAFDGQLARLYRESSGTGYEIDPAKRPRSMPPGSEIAGWLDLEPSLTGQVTVSQYIARRGARRVDDAEIAGLNCIVLEASADGDAERWWVCPDRDWIAVKHERTSDGGPFAPDIVSRKATWAVGEMIQVDGRWMPSLLTCEGGNTRADGRQVWGIRQKVNLIYHSARELFPEETFRPPFPPGTKVYGVKEYYVVPTSG